KDGHENHTLRGRVTASVTDSFKLEAFGSYSDSETDVDGFGPSDDTGENLSLSEEYLVGARAHLDLMDGRFSNTLSVEYSGIDRASVSAFGTFAGKGNRLNFDYLGNFEVSENWFITGGAQHERVEAETVTSESHEIDSVFGVVAYEQSGLNLSVGLRLDDHSVFGSTTNAQIRGAYTVADTGTKVFANWGEGFKAPSINQLTYICGFCGLTEPSSDLQPEASDAWELGIEQKLLDGSLKLGATYFSQDTEDLIIFTFTGGYENVDRAKSKGVELFVEANVSDTLRFNANYTYNKAEDQATDTQLIRRPKNKFYAAATWDVMEALSANISVTHNGEILDTGVSTVDDWTTVDLRISYQLVENVELYGRINNLFDADYQVITGYATPGIASYFGVRASF
ncbi:MAG: TonB-dependent receptor, partial [Kordiimonadaceae bacterium]|nr:TonB-dependent receptor [Kordiimonadaceae bacterium]